MAELQSPEIALRLKPGFELDVFVYRYVFDGVLEVVSGAKGQSLERPIPAFSRRADAAKSLLIKLVMEASVRQVTMNFGEEWWGAAYSAGQLFGDKPFPVWRVSIEGKCGYGGTIEEAICKLAIASRAAE